MATDAHAVTPTVHLRQDVWGLSHQNAWHPTLLWYARAITAMQTQPLAAPTGWRFQAAIHDYHRNTDPYASQGGPPPAHAVTTAFWKQCQHNSWFFLPWHRMYLGYFEAIVRANVAALHGPADWALPYWNYSDTSNPDAATLPPAFRDAKTPDNVANPLFIAARDTTINAGHPLDPSSVDISALTDRVFTGVSTGAKPGFGGPKTGFNHNQGNTLGSLEQTPHGDVHVNVGGTSPPGWMSSFDTAALDPVFWLHHCNIDRLWEAWRGEPGRVDPADAAWKNATGATFKFHDATGAVQQLKPGDVGDTTTTPFYYHYESLQVSGPPIRPQAPQLSERMSEPEHPAEMVGASLGPTALGAAPVTEHVAIHPPAGPLAANLTAAASVRPRAYLNVENVTASTPQPRYGVYLNVPADAADPHEHQGHFAGSLPMFGVAEASAASSEHGGGGLTYVLDVTDLIDQLKAAGKWDAGKLDVTFAPVRAGAAGDVKVGRVSLYYH